MRDPLWQMMRLEAALDERLFAARRFRTARDDWPPPTVEARILHTRNVFAQLRRRRTAGDNAACDVLDALPDDTRPDNVVVAGDMVSPERLTHLQSPPCLGLWCDGDVGLMSDDRVRVAIVGSRTARAESLMVARTLAACAAHAGAVVVSGLAIGVDGEAHRGALDAGGQTIAVLASGLQRLYPRRHAGIVNTMCHGARAGAPARGLVVSEYGSGANEPRPYRFRERNRIIAALSDYVVIVQAHERSGSINTAEEALTLGVPVGVVVSSINDPDFVGSMRLLSEGAECITDASSLIRLLASHGLAAVRGGDATPAHPLASLLTVPRPLADVARLAGLGQAETRRMLIDLELQGLARRSSDGLWIATQRP